LSYLTGDWYIENKFWVFDNRTRSWLPKNNFPGFSTKLAITYFTLNNKGYVLFGDNTFASYDPLTDIWTKLASYPGQPPSTTTFGRISYVVNNKGYVGLGRNSVQGIEYNDIWIYDPNTDSWSQGTPFPLSGRYNSVSFVVNNKAYIGFGFRNYTLPVTDLYEFNPDF
jgi:N-acetylneuraminic acid mutarotase